MRMHASKYKKIGLTLVGHGSIFCLLLFIIVGVTTTTETTHSSAAYTSSSSSCSRSNRNRTFTTTTTTTTTMKMTQETCLKNDHDDDDNNNNSSSNASSIKTLSKTLALGAGCYWGTEKFVVKDFQKLYPHSIVRASVGFMSLLDTTKNKSSPPTYRQVCSGTTGFVEVLWIELRNPAETFEPLIRFFFQFHDPTTMNRQGNDVGTQYASVIFCGDENENENENERDNEDDDDGAQYKIAQNVKAQLQAHLEQGRIAKHTYQGRTVTTKILQQHGRPFYPAHEEHQQYLANNPNGYCNHYLRFSTWPSTSSSSS